MSGVTRFNESTASIQLSVCDLGTPRRQPEAWERAYLIKIGRRCIYFDARSTSVGPRVEPLRSISTDIKTACTACNLTSTRSLPDPEIERFGSGTLTPSSAFERLARPATQQPMPLCPTPRLFSRQVPSTSKTRAPWILRVDRRLLTITMHRSSVFNLMRTSW